MSHATRAVHDDSGCAEQTCPACDPYDSITDKAGKNWLKTDVRQKNNQARAAGKISLQSGRKVRPLAVQ